MILLCVCVRENSGRVGEVGLDRLTEQIICHWILIIACLVRCRANPGDEEDDAVGGRIRNNVIVGKPSCLLRLSLSASRRVFCAFQRRRVGGFSGSRDNFLTLDPNQHSISNANNTHTRGGGAVPAASVVLGPDQGFACSVESVSCSSSSSSLPYTVWL